VERPQRALAKGLWPGPAEKTTSMTENSEGKRQRLSSNTPAPKVKRAAEGVGLSARHTKSSANGG